MNGVDFSETKYFCQPRLKIRQRAHACNLLLFKERSIGPRLKIGNSSLGLFLSMDQEIDMLSWHNSYFFALSIGDIIDNVGVPIEESSSFLHRDHFEILEIEIAQSSNKRVEVLEFIHEIQCLSCLLKQQVSGGNKSTAETFYRKKSTCGLLMDIWISP